jgi:hypothetical protein
VNRISQRDHSVWGCTADSEFTQNRKDTSGIYGSERNVGPLHPELFRYPSTRFLISLTTLSFTKDIALQMENDNWKCIWKEAFATKFMALS